MRKFTALLLTLIMIFLLCSCSSQSEKPTDNTATKDEVLSFANPVKKNWESTDNNIGARYTFTLDEFTQMLNDAYIAMGSSYDQARFDKDNWQILSDGLTDDNGVKYDSYYYQTESLVLTAAVEQESKKIMNVGCGCNYDLFVKKDADYQYSVLIMSALIGVVAGGYGIEDLEFMYDVFYDVTYSETAFFYNNAVYLINYNEAESDDKSTVLYMVSPAPDNILVDWKLTDYTKYTDSVRYEETQSYQSAIDSSAAQSIKE